MANTEVVYLHYFATADSGLAEVLRANPNKMLVYYDKKLISLRRYSSLDFFTQDELDFYCAQSKVKWRLESVQSIDFGSVKKGLIGELEDLHTNNLY
ncbi:TPA: hypothetical protein ACGO1T_001708 [Streptococcus suis]